MRKLFSTLIFLYSLCAYGQIAQNTTPFTGTILPTDNHYVNTFLNGQLRKVQLYRIGQDRIDSAVTAMATYSKLQRMLDSLEVIKNLLAQKQDAGEYVTATDLANLANGKQDAGDYVIASAFTPIAAKVDGIQNGATANLPDSQLLKFANHTDKITPDQIDASSIETLDIDALQNETQAVLQALGTKLIKQPVAMDILTLVTNSGNLSGNNGRYIYMPVVFQKKDTVRSLGFEVTTAGSSDLAMTANTKLGLYKSNGDGTAALVCSTATISDASFESQGVKTFAVTATVGGGSEYVAEPGLYFVGLLYNQSAATTSPQLRGATSRALANQHGGTTYKIYGYVSGTDLPSTITLSSATGSGAAHWIGIYK